MDVVTNNYSSSKSYYLFFQTLQISDTCLMYQDSSIKDAVASSNMSSLVYKLFGAIALNFSYIIFLKVETEAEF